MDTEGFEPRVYQMMLDANVLKQIQDIVVEITRKNWHKYGITDDVGFDVFRQMFGLGFIAVDITSKKGRDNINWDHVDTALIKTTPAEFRAYYMQEEAVLPYQDWYFTQRHTHGKLFF